MSEDYYLVCRDKKIYMPIFSMSMGSIGLSDKRWVFDFILACEGKEIKFLHEQSEEMPNHETEKEGEWKLINAWHPYKEQE